jgi:hypothetical protein
MVRARDPQSVEIHLRVSPAFLARVDQFAGRLPLVPEDCERPSRSAVIRRAVLLGLDKLEANQKKKQKG